MARYDPITQEIRPEGGTMDTVHAISTTLDQATEYIHTRVATLLLKHNYSHTYSFSGTDIIAPDHLLNKATVTEGAKSMCRHLLEFEGGFIMVTTQPSSGRVWFCCVTHSLSLCKDTVNNFIDQCDPWTGAEVEAGQVRVHFWNMTSRGPVRRSRKLEMPTWDEIKGNYEHVTANELHEFMTMKEWDDSRGKLIIWRGDPGLGKTYALRAMCENWKDWASIHYIADPEAFLGDPDYLYTVMGFEEGDGLASTFSQLIEELEADEDEPTATQHRLIILEDAGELVGATARTETGQALSRLLNAVDGMFGQGTQCVLMITTNEEKRKLHEAVGRHGRCAKDVMFQKFTTPEAEDWLEVNGGNPSDAQPNMSLSDLYAAKHSHQNGNAEKPKLIGFAG